MNDDEYKIVAALRGNGPLTTREISDRVNIRQARTYRMLRSLAKYGIIQKEPIQTSICGHAVFVWRVAE